MGKVITFINEKGGIGKTSVCFNVAWEVSKNKKVLMIDMDGQRANLTYFCGIEKAVDILTMADVLKKEKAMEEATLEVKRNLDLIPAAVDVADISQTVKVRRMKDAILSIKEKYDYIFIDVSPSPDWRHFLSLSASDYALVIMLPDMTSLESDNGIIESIDEVQGMSNPELKILGIVFNRNEDRTNMSKTVKEISNVFAEKMNTKVFKNHIRNAVIMGEVAYAHEGVTDYDPSAAVAEDVRNVAKELIRRSK